MKALLFLACIAVLVWFWQHSLAIRERAINRCRKTCDELGLQFLDQTVSLAAVSVNRTARRITLLRRYNFEFSREGVDRYRGYVLMSGATIYHLQLHHPDGDIIINRNEHRQMH